MFPRVIGMIRMRSGPMAAVPTDRSTRRYLDILHGRRSFGKMCRSVKVTSAFEPSPPSSPTIAEMIFSAVGGDLCLASHRFSFGAMSSGVCQRRRRTASGEKRLSGAGPRSVALNTPAVFRRCGMLFA